MFCSVFAVTNYCLKPPYNNNDNFLLQTDVCRALEAEETSGRKFMVDKWSRTKAEVGDQDPRLHNVEWCRVMIMITFYSNHGEK